ncbi:pre-mRNA-processing factor 39-like isoform X2 [Tubulanus polymorphus]|uniref:pre-mRNA-processing factor 39-like isoform X2 n=1 Tax=Tubulanus polymorphus TaxID=672921 RepID=UPI003DA420B8
MNEAQPVEPVAPVENNAVEAVSMTVPPPPPPEPEVGEPATEQPATVEPVIAASLETQVTEMQQGEETPQQPEPPKEVPIDQTASGEAAFSEAAYSAESVPTEQAMAVQETKPVEVISAPPVIERKVPPRSPELEKYWKAVNNNSSDFTGWTYLLQYVEQENIMEHACEAFDAFFNRYPYCYGYWKKYADLHRKNNKSIQLAQETYERGVTSNPLSVDLWIHYINFAATHLKFGTEEEKEETLRALYSRAVRSCGMEFRSDKLWDQYINWEKDLKKYMHVYKLYECLLQIPTLSYSHHFESFKTFVQERSPKELLSLDEFLVLREEVVKEQQAKQEDALPGTGEDEGPPGMEVPPGEEAPPGEGVQLSPKMDAKESKAIQEKIVEKQQAVHIRNEEEVSKRWSFEEGIRRPYFHVKPLERAQLKNWKEYLDFEIENGTYERTIVLFERCMIACALYEEFWLKYAKYLESNNKLNEAEAIYRRACITHLPKKPSIHIAWSAFAEKQENSQRAIEILENLEILLPGLAQLIMRRVGLYRRLGNFEMVEKIFNENIEKASSVTLSSFFAKKYARFLFTMMKKKAQAMEVLLAAVQKDKLNHNLHLLLLDIEYHSEDRTDHAMMEIFDMVLQNEEFPLEFRLQFSRRKLEYLEDFGSDVNALLRTYDEHQKIVKDYKLEEKKKLTEQGEKHGAIDQLGGVAKKARYDETQQQQQQQQYNYGWEGYSGYNNNYNNYYNSQYYQQST